MQFDPIQLDLATRDLYLQKIQDQIMAKRSLLLAKQKMLRKTAKQNHLLNDIMQDYATYYQFIIKQKQDQIRSMEIIKQYLNDIIVSGNFAKTDIIQAKKEQKVILGEINNIRENLYEIMNQTDNLQKIE